MSCGAFASAEAILSAAGAANGADVGAARTVRVADLARSLAATAHQSPGLLAQIMQQQQPSVRTDGACTLVSLWVLSSCFLLLSVPPGELPEIRLAARALAHPQQAAALRHFFDTADVSFLFLAGPPAVHLSNSLTRLLAAVCSSVSSHEAAAPSLDLHESAASLVRFAKRFCPLRPDALTIPLVSALQAAIAADTPDAPDAPSAPDLSRPLDTLLGFFDQACAAAGVPHLSCSREVGLTASDVAQWFSLRAQAHILRHQFPQALEALTLLLSLPAARAHPLQARAARTRILLLLLVQDEGAPLPQLMAPHVKSDLQAKPAALLTQARGVNETGLNDANSASSTPTATTTTTTTSSTTSSSKTSTATTSLGMHRQARGGSQSAALLAAAEEAKRMLVYTSFERAYKSSNSAAVQAVMAEDRARVFAQDKTLALAQACITAHPARAVQRAARLYQSVPLSDLADFLHLDPTQPLEAREERVRAIVQDAVCRGWVKARWEGPNVFLSHIPRLGALASTADSGSSSQSAANALRQALNAARRDSAAVADRSRQVEASPAFLVAASGSLVGPTTSAGAHSITTGASAGGAPALAPESKPSLTTAPMDQ